MSVGFWPEADRRRAGRQATSFWIVALLSLGLSSLSTGLDAADGPSGGVARLAVVSVAYVGTSGALWVVKFVVYQRYLFRPPSPGDPRLADRPPG